MGIVVGVVSARGTQRIDKCIARSLTVRRIRDNALIAIIAAIGIVAATYLGGDAPFDIYGHPFAVDLTAHLAGGRIAGNSDFGHLYDVATQVAAERSLLGGRHPEFLDLFVSPPFMALVYRPLARWPYVTSSVLWSLLSISLIVVSLRLLWPLLPQLHRFGFGTVLLVCVSAWPTIEVIVAGQDSAVALLILVLGLRLLVGRQDLLAGAVLGLGAFKPTLFLLIPIVLLLERRPRALLTCLGVGATLALVSLGLVGMSGLESDANLLSSEFWHGANAQNWWKIQSIPALLQIGIGGISSTVLAAVAIIVGHALLVGGRWRKEWVGGDPRIGFGLAILITALVSPHLFVYDCLILVIPALLLFDANPSSTSVRILLLVGWVATWTAALRFLAFGAFPSPFWLLAASPLPIIIGWLAFEMRRHLVVEPGVIGTDRNLC